MATYGKSFWLDAFERALKTAAQAPIAAWAAAKVSNIYEIDLKSACGVIAFAFILSLLMSVGSAQVGNGNSASLVKSLALWLGLGFLVLAPNLACTADPRGQAAEIRALYKEAQVQIDLASHDPGVDPRKVTDLKDKLAQAGPFIDALEVAADLANKDPSKWINFQTLWVEYKPKVESILISVVLKRYLGV